MKFQMFTGSQIKQFYDAWPMGDDWYHAGSDFEFFDEDEKFILDLAQKYYGYELGEVCWQGAGPVPYQLRIGDYTVRVEESFSGSIDFQTVLKVWLHQQTHDRIVADVPKDKVREFLQMCESHGWSVVK